MRAHLRSTMALGCVLGLSACLPPFELGLDGMTGQTTNDLATSGGQDLATASPDLSISVDLAHAPDLAKPPDLGIAAVSFATTVKPLLTSNDCLECHMTTAWSGSEALASAAMIQYLETTKSSQCPTLPFITAGNAANSYLFQKIQGSGSCFTDTVMPKGQAALSAAQIASVKSWIEAGAPNN